MLKWKRLQAPMKNILIYLFLFLFFVFSALSSGTIDSQDGFQYLAVARNIYYKGQPTAPDYEYDTRENIHMSIIIGKDGKTYSLTGLGFTLAYLPAVAATDIFYKIYGVEPDEHFPLNSDWLILLFASMTNSFFAASLGVILFVYLTQLGLNKKQSLIITLVGLFSTNLLVYSKHSFPHMMVAAFLFLTFFLVRQSTIYKKNLYLALAGLSFGITLLTYNRIILLSLLPLSLYYLQLQSFKVKLKPIILGGSLFVLGVLPLFATYIWFEELKTLKTGIADPLNYTKAVASYYGATPVSVFIEGFYGQLLSPGRSVFIYSPILLIIIFFWFKLKKNLPELWAFLSISIIYILFYTSIYNSGDPAKGIFALWHGEASWGPRYLTILLPFAILIIGVIYKTLSLKTKLFAFYPLVALGVYIQFLGTVMPYQIKLHDLEDRFFVNETEYTNYLYSNLLPRYSPVFMMSKKLVKLSQTLPKTLDHSIYNVKFFDGIDFPFNVGTERWRVVDAIGYISFDNNKANPAKTITLGMINHPIEEATDSAIITFSLNNTQLSDKPIELKLSERKLITLDLPDNLVKDTGNLLVINADYQSPFLEKDFIIPENRNLSLLKTKPQILAIISFAINNHTVNLESLDFPYVSQLGPAITGATYRNYGSPNQDNWLPWHIHTQIYERVPDFWWFKSLYYWDMPTKFILAVATLNIAAIIYTGAKLFLFTRKN